MPIYARSAIVRFSFCRRAQSAVQVAKRTASIRSNMSSSTSKPSFEAYKTFNSDLPPLSRGIPSTYSRLYLDPSTIPSTKIVGILACQRDPYLRSLTTRITAARETIEVTKSNAVERSGSANGGKKDKKAGGKQAKETKAELSISDAANGSADSASKTWELEFEDTVLFPEGGGQPNDTGLVRMSASGGWDLTLKVVNVFRKGLTAVHVVEIPSERKAKDVVETLAVGTEITLEVDWERRVDHMTQHTAQHLLSALADTHLSLPTLSWFLPPHPSLEPCYIELSRPLTPAEAKHMETLANELVTLGWGGKNPEDDVDVWIESRVQGYTGGGGSAMGSGAVTPAVKGDESADAVEKKGLGLVEGVREQVEAEIENDGEGKTNGGPNEIKEWGDRESRGLPKDYAGGVIRTAVISGIDRSLCCGTHHPLLSPIKLVHVLPPAPSASTKTSRLYMVAGPRAFRHLIDASTILSETSRVYAVQRGDVAKVAEQREGFRKDTDRGCKALRAELGRSIGADVKWQEAEGDTLTPLGARKALLIRGEEATHDFDFMGTINTAAVTTLAERVVALEKVQDPKYLLVIMSTLTSNTVTSNSDASNSLIQITSNPPQLAKDVGDKLKAGIDGLTGGGQGRVRGGGAKGRWMGKVTGKWGKAEAKVLSGLLD